MIQIVVSSGAPTGTISRCLHEYVFQTALNFPDQLGSSEDDLSGTLDVDGETAHLDCIDDNSSDPAPTARDERIRHADGLLIVFSLQSQVSFGEVSPQCDHFLEVKSSDEAPIVIVGHRDFDDDSRRRVARFAGEQLAARYHGTYCEISHSNREENLAAFRALVRLMQRTRRIGSRNSSNQSNKDTCSLM